MVNGGGIFTKLNVTSDGKTALIKTRQMKQNIFSAVVLVVFLLLLSIPVSTGAARVDLVYKFDRNSLGITPFGTDSQSSTDGNFQENILASASTPAKGAALPTGLENAPALYLLGTGLIGLVGFRRRRRD